MSPGCEKGRTHVLDAGLPIGTFTDYIQSFSNEVALVKIGWGLSLLDPRLATSKVSVCKSHGLSCSPGGTLLEYFLWHGRSVDEFEEFALNIGFDTVEVSDGTIPLSNSERSHLIKRLRKTFTVVSEVGAKDSKVVVAPYKWVDQIRSDLGDGVSFVILEGRESGTAGLYRESGEVRHGLIREILDSGIGPDSLVFEAPKKDQQVEVIQVVGPNVNLGNVHFSDVQAVKSLRLGLRSDTLRNSTVWNLGSI